MKTLILFMLLLLVPQVAAQQLGPIQNTDGRKTISLDGEWKMIVDPYESGFYDYRYQPSANGYFKNAKPKTKTDLIEYDFDKSGSLKVPGDWNTQSDQLLSEMIARDKNRAAVVIWSEGVLRLAAVV